MKKIALLLPVILLLLTYQYTNAEELANLRDIRAALQSKQFREAVKLIDSTMSSVTGDKDFLLYLKGLALFYNKNYSEAISPCDQVIKDYPKTAWYRKALFLKAQAYIQLKRFEEAERIYDGEVRRLLSETRKEEMAMVYFRFAEAISHKPGKDELDAPPPNYDKAHDIYMKALELEIGKDMKDEAMFRLGKMKQLAGDFGMALQYYHKYLDEFDPHWIGSVEAIRLNKSVKREFEPGKHIYEARYNSALCRLNMGQDHWARIDLEELLKLIKNSEKITRDAKFLIIRTYRIPQPRNVEDLELGVKAGKEFIKSFPSDPRTVTIAYEISQTYQNMGRSEEAIREYREFLKIDPASIILLDKEDTEEEYLFLDNSFKERFEQLRMSATYTIGEILYSQRQYDKATEIWSQYIAQFPNGPQWAQAQQSIINAEFQMGVDLMTQEKYEEAIKIWDKFLEKHPLDHRSRQIMFTYGQLHYHLADSETDISKKNDEYKKAISEWEKLISKYPNTEESSLALFRTGQIYEEKLGDLEKALESYRKLTWGSWHQEAQNRIRAMTQKNLQVVTERVFRTNETAKVKVTLRNIEKLTVNIYKVDMEAYWRKMQGITGIESLDIALIAPDETYEYKFEDYQKYKPFEKEIEIKMDGAGACAVHIGEEDLEATTLVIRSDIDAIIKTSRREVMVFAQHKLEKVPASKARVLISDGSKVIAEGETGEDGVFQAKPKELKDTSRITAFIISNGSVASDALNIADLGISQGLNPRGYIYTDRPAYRPGQKVSIKGIIRDVKQGAYSVSSDTKYQVSINDSRGRMLYSEELKLSIFGTFHTEMMLDSEASTGEYQILVQAIEEKEKVFNGNFRVERYQLEKIKLSLDFSQSVYFRGEQVEATFTASYYYGQPLKNKPIRYTMPDGRTYTEETDQEGILKIKFDTTSMNPDSHLLFIGSIEGENVRVEGVVFLARLGFSIEVSPSAETVISGEPFDVNIQTKGADGKPIGKELTLTVYRQMEQKSHPILSQVPWIGDRAKSAGELKVSEYKVTTDEKTGKGSINIELVEGGRYTLRANGLDRFNQPVSGENAVFISDDKDAVKLRIFAQTTNLKVGESQKVRIHSRLKPSLALITFEGEDIIHYKIMELSEGWNDLDFAVGHEHFPNFHIAVAMIEGQKLHASGKDFTVERQLMISIKLKEFYLPGEEAEVQLIVTDQLGKPVESELSLALVDEALFAIYPDNLQPINDFFNEGIHRYAAMKVTSSNTFRYQPPTRPASKELLAEERRLDEVAKYEVDRRKTLEAVDGDIAFDLAEKEKAMDKKAFGLEVQRARVMSAVSAPSAAPDEFAYFNAVGEAGGRGLGRGEDIAVREEHVDAGYWLPNVTTDKNGKASAKVKMPENTTQWRLTARGCTVETLVGQKTENTITRKDFFVDVKVPSILTEGDKIRVLSRVHNMTDFAGDVSLNLKISIDGQVKADSKITIKIEKNDTKQAIFDAVEITPGREARIEVIAKAGNLSDGISRTIAIRPWGMEYADSKGGVSSGNETIFIQLPKDLKYNSKRLDISVGPDVNRLIFDLAMDRPMPRSIILSPGIPPMPGDSGSDLLAAVYALKYLKSIAGTGDYTSESARLTAYARNLVARLVTTQRNDGGWSWLSGKADSDIYASSRSFWALIEARNYGIIVHTQTIEKATSYLKTAFARAEQNDDDAKSIILHALSCVNDADFAYANRLYRNRNSLKAPALAYTALVFANMDRKEIGGEVLDVLQSMTAKVEDTETIALTALAMVSIRPGSPDIKRIIDKLLSKRYFYGFSPYRAKGPAVAALALYYEKIQFIKSDYRLKVIVNGKEVKDIKAVSQQPAFSIPVSADLIQDGQNKVEFILNGTGRYSYTVNLSGFSSEFKDSQAWEKPNIQSRKYYHAPLEYKGRILSPSTTEITQLEDGQQAYVWTDLQEGSLNRYIMIQEYIPSGMTFVEDSLSGNYRHYQIGDGVITLYFQPNEYIQDYRYQLVSYAPGTYRAMPTIIRDVMKPEDYRISKLASLDVLAPGEKSKDEYKMNDSELYEFGKAYFDDGEYSKSLKHLTDLYDRNKSYNQRELARMLLWIHTEKEHYNSRKVVEFFEILRERFPELYIPFDKILVVGKAYRDMEEFERAYLVYKATIDASYINDSNISAVLEDEGQFLTSIDFQENLWREYPDSPQVISSYFALSQLIYSKVQQAQELAKSELKVPLLKDQAKPDSKKITKLDLLRETVLMLNQFLTLYPDDPLSDDAAFSLANAMLDLNDYERVVSIAKTAQKRYPESEYITGFQYVEALGFFSQRKYDEAVEAARLVADGKSKDRDLAIYILGQIYHARGKPENAMEWYEKVKNIYPDAGESISYFQEKKVSLDEVKIVRPGEDSKIAIKYRNIKEAFIQVYQVDLMKLYLREKDLSKIRSVQLAGINPKFSQTISLGDGKDYVDKEKEIDLNLKDEGGAYLVICRGDDLFSSGLVLLTPLGIDVQEDEMSGRVRVNVRDVVKNTYQENVHVKVVGSEDKVFKSGETDLRGLFIADNVRGIATVIARGGKNQYAFHRGVQRIGPAPVRQQVDKPAPIERYKADYRANIDVMNQAIQQQNFMEFDQMRRGGQKGVQVQAAQ